MKIAIALATFLLLQTSKPAPTTPKDEGADEGTYFVHQSPLSYGFSTEGTFALKDELTYVATARIATTGDGEIVQMAPSDYDRLQSLRLAVQEYENKLAVKYGVRVTDNLNEGCTTEGTSTWCVRPAGWKYIPADKYEFRGPFLLINVAASVPLPTIWPKLY